MRSYVLTESERRIIKRFVEKQEKLEGFRMLRSRIKKYRERILEDAKLIEQFSELILKETRK